MPSRYHPIEDGLWNDEKLEGAPFEEKGFFAFLCANERQKPAGIYRATDQQLAADTGLPDRRVRSYLADLAGRGRIVRDGAWIFVRSYFARVPKTPHLLKAAERCIMDCPSSVILEAFSQKYPMFSQWSTDRLATIGQRSGIPLDQLGPGEERERNGRGTGTGEDGSDQTPALDPALAAILGECPHLALVNNGASADFWDQVLGACEPYPLADGRWLGAKLRKWNQWFEDHPHRRSRVRQYLQSRLMGWLTKDLEALARMKP